MCTNIQDFFIKKFAEKKFKVNSIFS